MSNIMPFDLNAVPSQQGKIAIVTGANIGLGYETVRGLLKKDMTVVMACRSLARGEAAKTALLQEIPQADIHVMLLDLSKLVSVRAFASAYLAAFEQLDLLINNAGIMVPPYVCTEDGFESQMAANYFGHFLLTSLLLPLMETTGQARIVSLSSIAHRDGFIQFDDINFEQKYSRMQAYRQSKLACLMFGLALNKQLCARESTVMSVIAHPGVSITNLVKNFPTLVRTYLMPLVKHAITHSPEAGALPTLYAALGADIKGGDFTGPTGFFEMKGPAGKVAGKPHAYHEEKGVRLWKISEQLVGQSFF